MERSEDHTGKRVGFKGSSSGRHATHSLVPTHIHKHKHTQSHEYTRGAGTEGIGSGKPLAKAKQKQRGKSQKSPIRPHPLAARRRLTGRASSGVPAHYGAAHTHAHTCYSS